MSIFPYSLILLPSFTFEYSITIFSIFYRILECNITHLSSFLILLLSYIGLVLIFIPSPPDPSPSSAMPRARRNTRESEMASRFVRISMPFPWQVVTREAGRPTMKNFIFFCRDLKIEKFKLFFQIRMENFFFWNDHQIQIIKKIYK